MVGRGRQFNKHMIYFWLFLCLRRLVKSVLPFDVEIIILIIIILLLYIIIIIIIIILSLGSCHHAWVADGGVGPQVWRLAANILNKQSWTADQEWSSSLGVLA